MDTQMDEYMDRWKERERENGQTGKEMSGKRKDLLLGKKRKPGRGRQQAKLR